MECDKMDIPTELWFDNLRQRKRKKSHRRIDEISRAGVRDTFEYMAGRGPQIQTEFDYLFGGHMRVALPLVESDTRNLREVVEALKAEGWRPPLVNPGGESVAVAFPTKLVKQKKRREGGEEYEQEARVASLELIKEFDYLIPAGPRKGETVKKTNKTTMSRAIANAVKFKRLRPELLVWWRKKQTFYTQDEDGYNLIENVFEGDIAGDEWSILLSRHPVDVLRMSDVGDITSCHREGTEYFKCAVEESKGNGLIAYLVKTEDLNGFLRAGDPHMALANDLINRSLNREDTLDVAHKHLNSAQELAMVLKLLKSEWARWALPSGEDSYNNRASPEAIEVVTVDMFRDAVHAKLNNKPWPDPAGLPPPKPLGDFDQQEIFHDRDRDVIGISASSRLRIRKYLDTANGNWIAVPEDRVYGRNIDRFRTAVREWAWSEQSEMFIDEARPGLLELPRSGYLQRYGGSYEDTGDGTLLNQFFSMSGTNVTSYHGNVEHVHEDEDGDEFEEWEAELEEVLSAAQNRAEHIDFGASVEEYDANQPYVSGGASLRLSFDIDRPGELDDSGSSYIWPDDEREYTTIPKPWAAGPAHQFERLIDGEIPMHVAETHWEVATGLRANAHQLHIDLRFDFEELDVQQYDGFADYLIDEIDEKYDEIFEKLRRALVTEDYLPPSDFDRLIDDIREQSSKLENWNVVGADEDDDYDGEIWFTFKAALPGGSKDTWIKVATLPASRGNTPFALEKIFGGAARMEAHGRINPGITFRTELNGHLAPLIDAANGYAEEQLQFDFGEEYNRPTFQGVDFGGSSQLRFMLTGDEVFFLLKVVIDSDTSQEEIEGAFKFMEFVDRYPQQIIGAIKATYDIFVQHKNEEDAARHERYMNGELMQKFKADLDSKYGAAADRGDDTNAEGVMLVVMFVEQNWKTFNQAEKYAAIDRYLRPLKIGSLSANTAWDVENEVPFQWNEAVRAEMQMLKAPNAANYAWAGERSAGAPGVLARLQNRMGMTPEESVKANHELHNLTDEERSKAMAALVAGDKEEFIRIIRGDTLRGTIGEPVPAGGPIVRNARGERMAESRRSNRAADAEAEAQGKEKPQTRRYDPSRYEHGDRNLSSAEAIWAWKQIRKNYLETDEAAWKYIDSQPGETDEQKVVAAFDTLRASETIEEQINRIDHMLAEREPIDLRIYKVALGCVVDTDIAGTDSQIENQIRGIEEVTTVSHRVDLERNVGSAALYRVYEVKFELYGQQARDTYRDSVLVPSIEKEVTGVTVRDRGLPELAAAPLREWGGLGYAAPPYDHYLPTMVTPAVGLQTVLDDWAEGGVQIYDTPMNTNQMRYHVMMPVSDLWDYCSRYYRGNKADFDGRYKHFIKDGAQMPVYVALGQNGRVRITGNEDLIWFAKKSGLEELPVFFSYQRQV
jgi:hypothetical protein